jgi:two-component system cit operon sensor histidine kinase CitA
MADEHGIGLYLIASYVGRCGGVITLEDNDPYGALFTVFIPKVKKTHGTTSNDIDS